MMKHSQKPDDDFVFLRKIGRSGDALAAKPDTDALPTDVYKRSLARAHAAQLQIKCQNTDRKTG